LLEEEQNEQARKTLEHLEEGSVLTGTVKNLTDYGAFVDLGGIDGLLHITDMSWGRLTHPKRPGQRRRRDPGQGSEVRQRQAARLAGLQAAHA
jgi:polyribonucleotide nucleotidyltransferase